LKTQLTRKEINQLGSDFLLAGTIGGITQTILSPLERTKLLLQAQDPSKGGGPKGLVDCFKRISTEQGYLSFWRGNLVNCLHYAPLEGSALALNDFFNNSVFPSYSPTLDFWRSFETRLLSGGLAGAVAHTLTYPLDFARTRMAVASASGGKQQFNGVMDCLRASIRNQGITGIYSGWMSTCLSAFIFRAGQLGVFKQIQDFNPYRMDQGINGAASSFLAVTAGRTAVMPLTYPLELVRRKLMLQSEKPLMDRVYKGSWDCFAKTFRHEGIMGMYKGVLPELFRGVGGSLVIVIYDRTKLIFGM